MTVAATNLSADFGICCISAGNTYQVTLRTASGVVDSADVLAPRRSGVVRNLLAQGAPKFTGVMATWRPPLDGDGLVTDYLVTLTLDSGAANCVIAALLVCQDCPERLVSSDTPIPSGCGPPVGGSFHRAASNVTWASNNSAIRPVTSYNITIIPRNGFGWGEAFSTVFRTREFTSGPVSNLAVNSTFPSAPLTISWMPPSVPNGEINQYFISVLSGNKISQCALEILINCTDCKDNTTMRANFTDTGTARCGDMKYATFNSLNKSYSIMRNDPIIEPFMDYEIMVIPWNAYGGGISSKVSLKTDPYTSGSVSNLTATSKFQLSRLTISWMPPSVPNGEINQYFMSLLSGNKNNPCVLEILINCTDCKDNTTMRANFTDTGTARCGDIKYASFNSHDAPLSIMRNDPIIEPVTDYVIIVIPLNAYGGGNSSNFSIKTGPYKSGPVLSLFAKSTFPSAPLTISWKPPLVPNGEINQYFISVLSGNKNSQCVLEILINCTDCKDNTTMRTNFTDTGTARCGDMKYDSFNSLNKSLSIMRNDSIITPFTDYIIIVIPLNAYGGGNSSNVSLKTGPYKSGAVVNLSVSSTFPEDNLQISWAAPKDLSGTVFQYIISVHTSKACVLSSSVNCSNCANVTFTTPPCRPVIERGLFISTDRTFSFNVTNPIIQPDSEFTIRVVPLNEYGEGTASNVSVKTPIYFPPQVSRFQSTPKESNIDVSWGAPVSPPSINTYQLTFNDQTVTLNRSFTQYTFSGVKYCSSYAICIWTTTPYGNSSKNCTTTNTVSSPSSITGLFQYPQKTSIYMNWTFLNPNDTCQIYFTVDLNNAPRNTSTPSFLLSSLEPFKNYSIQVNTFTFSNLSAVRAGTSRFVTGQTLEDVPGEVTKFKCSNSSFNNISCSWADPLVPNGIISRCWLICSMDDGVLFNDNVTNVFTFTISGAVPDVPYFCQIRASTSAGYGNPVTSNLTITSSITADVSNEDAIPAVMNTSILKPDKGWSQLAITLPYAFFSNRKGIIRMFTLVINPTDSVVTRSSAIQQLQPVEKSFKDCDGKRDTCVYEIMLPNPVANGRQRRSTSDPQWLNMPFKIGTGADCNTNMFCNGELMSSQKYQIAFRAYTLSGFVSVGHITMHTQLYYIPIVVGLLVPFFVGVFVVGLYFYIRYKRNQLPHGQLTPPLIEDISVNESVLTHKRSPEVHEFHANFEYMQTDSNGRMIDDFQEIRDKVRQLEIQQRLVIAEGNDPKNRYNNIKPYKHNRVKLLGNNDYINASRICTRHWGADLENQCDCTDIYIATQGPLDDSREGKLSTIGDFWRMVFENDVCVIVNLTKCMENGKAKCSQYWPETPRTPVTYLTNGDDVEVIMQSINENQIFAERILHVSMYGRSKSVTQLHINSWLDHSCPKSSEFLQFYMNYQKVRIKSSAVVVHCSAGVGRTGTFILIDEELTRITKETDKVEIFNNLLKLRKCRCQMVQTDSQYCFVYTIIHDYLIQKGLIKVPNNHTSDAGNVYRQSYENPIFNDTD